MNDPLTFKALVQACGLSIREAAEFLDVSEESVKSWLAGRKAAPDGVKAELSALGFKIIRTASETLRLIEEQAAARPGAGLIELGLASDDYEAQGLGWPCVGAHRTCLGLVAALAIQAGHVPKIVPRGSTVGTAAAADRHERGKK